MKKAGFRVREDIVPVHMKYFADGSARAQIMSTIRRTEVFFFYAPPLREPEKGLTQLATILNAIHLASPSVVKVVMPYFEGRQDRKDAPRTSMNAKVTARTIEKEGSVKGFITFDLHSEQLTMAFDWPVDNLPGHELLAEHSRQMPGWTRDSVGVISPDVGSTKRARIFAEVSGFRFLGIIDKGRPEANIVGTMRYIGDSPAGLHIIIPDDLGDTAGTMAHAKKKIMEEGATDCTAYLTHWLGSPKDVPGNPALFTAEAKLRAAGLRVVALNTIPRSSEYLAANKDWLTVIPCDDMLASAMMESLTPAGSVSKLSRKTKK